MGMLMGVNIQTPDSMSAGAASSAPAPSPKRKEPEPEPVKELSPEEQARADKKKEADAFKDKGNTAYKSKQFEEAIGFYKQALEVLPDEITYYNNMAAVQMEMKDFEDALPPARRASRSVAACGRTT